MQRLSCILILVCACASAQSLSFHARKDYQVGGDPGGLAVADFNRDGHLDLAVSGQQSQQISILFGAKGGTFSAPVVVGPAGSFIATADFNGDGNPDLAVGGGTTVGVMLGNGDGTFQPPQNYSVPFGVFWLGTADVDKDGKVDLVVANGDVTILYGNGDGTFQSPVATGAGPGVSSAVIADLNHDGRMDIAALISDNTTKPGSLVIMLGSAHNTFRRAGRYSAGAGPSALAVGDVNGDGHKDVVVAHFADTVALFLGDGTGKFLASGDVPSGVNFPAAVAIADVTGDGKPDIVTGNFSGSILGSSISVIASGGDGTFQPPVEYTTDTSLSALALADLNHDGHLDAVCTARNGRVSVLLNDGKGAFIHDAMFRVQHDASALASADFNGDGIPDLLVGSRSVANTVEVLIGLRSGRGFEKPIRIAVPGWSRGVAVGDFNGDGKPDIAAATGRNGSASATVALGRGDGTFGAPVTFAIPGTADAIVAGDFNHDGKLDLAVANHAGRNNGSISVLFGKGDGTFQDPVTSDLPGAAQSIVAGDFNGDGNPDIAVSTVNMKIAVMLGNGDGSFQPPAIVLQGLPFGYLAAADLNHDGKLDLAIAEDEVFFGAVWVLIGNGDGTFTKNLIPTGAPTLGIAVGDFNGDGIPDLASTNYYDSSVGVLSGNGDGTFQPMQFFGTEPGPVQLVSLDANHNGKSDIAAACGTNGVCLLWNNSPSH